MRTGNGVAQVQTSNVSGAPIIPRTDWTLLTAGHDDGCTDTLAGYVARRQECGLHRDRSLPDLKACVAR
jgi:hypothetical protein